MELIPDNIFSNPAYAGGVRLSYPEMMRIFYNVNRVLKVKRSIIHFSLGPKETDKYSYRCYEPEISVKINGTRVRVRGLTSDLSTVCVYDLQNDEFIIRLKRSIDPYGDKASASESDIKRRIIHSQRIKKYRRFLNENSIENDREIEDLRKDQEEFEELEVVRQ